MADQIDQLIKEKRAIKTRITRIAKFVASFQESNKIQDLLVREKDLERMFDQFNSVQLQLELLDNKDEKTETYEKEREGIENQYFSCLSAIDSWKQKMILSHNISKSEDNTGEAASVLSSLIINEENYIKALDILKDRYENILVVINHHLNTIFNWPTITKANLKEFLIQFEQSFESLKSLEAPVDNWDIILIYIISKKLDPAFRSAWELQRDSTKVPQLKELLTFLHHRATAYEVLNDGNDKPNKNLKVTHVSRALNTFGICAYCNSGHPIHSCSEFIKLSPQERLQFIKNKKHCYNCLRPYHFKHNCSKNTCKICHKNHHTMVHITKSDKASLSRSDEMPSASTTTLANKGEISNHLPTVVQPSVLLANNMSHQVLLSTAVVLIKNNKNQWQQARALLDSASEINLVTKKLADRLNLAKSSNDTIIQGVNLNTVNVNQSAKTQIKSRLNNSLYDIQLLITDNITVPLPHVQVNISNWNIPTNCKLADPNFNRPAEIDLLIGAELFFQFLKSGCIRLGSNLPLLVNTVFGWLVSGSVPVNQFTVNLPQVNLHMCQSSLEEQLKRFWQLEELQVGNQLLSTSEKECETNYEKTVARDSTGRYMVKLPVIPQKLNDLGDSFTLAFRYLRILEKRFESNYSLYSDYKKFIDEYVELNHAEYVTQDYIKNRESQNKVYYLPHHAVLRPESISTKLRVVFNASAPSSTGVSLNDALLAGPNLQPELTDIIIRFRTYKYAFTADIIKMFRQIKIFPDDRSLQLMLWREQPSNPIQFLQLNTVTYGTKSAPYLAYRTLLQLALDEGANFPLAADCIRLQFYMDDVLGGANTVEQAVALKGQLVQLLDRGQFVLHKWAANQSQILENYTNTVSNESLEITMDKSTVNTLGLKWNPNLDKFNIVIPIVETPKNLTKRQVLSFIARIFDPLGFLAPVLITAKLLIQNLWKSKLSWDEPIPTELYTNWNEFQQNLSLLKDISIPRFYFTNCPIKNIQLVGFCDSSEQAYGACVYILATYQNNTCSSSLVMCKTKVAPIKKLTIPRLELCGALLLGKLVNKLQVSFNGTIKIENSYYFSDSTIVLAWLKNPPTKPNIFVSNRISEILSLSSVTSWGHVKTSENPADLVTKGITPAQLAESRLWWNGPPWLLLPSSDWPSYKIESLTIEPDTSVSTCLSVNVTKHSLYWTQLFLKFSNFTKLKRIMAYIFRFIKILRKLPGQTKVSLSAIELAKSEEFIIKQIQLEAFSKEIQSLKDNKILLGSSKLLKLNPFLDENELLRVGGRIKHAAVSYNQKHPIILPAKNHVTRLIIQQEHIRLFHSGAQNVLANLRLRFWPINGRNEVKNIIFKCTICTRFKAKPAQQLMSDLPKTRVNFERPFLNVGIDYGGPIYYKSSPLRKAKLLKGYFCLIICMATRAIHIELVSDLSTEAFLAALRRFTARRGVCKTIFSDNATNFRGASNELNDIYKMLHNENENSKIADFTSELNITWHFNVPLASHMGGIYEAGIKSAKTLLKRKLYNTKFTYEQLYTVLVQVEGILNSRPLCPIMDTPDDMLCLTPGHFLIGSAMRDPPDHNLVNENLSKLSIWQRITRVKQEFWSQWHKQYLAELQTRTKWLNKQPNIKLGDIVLIKDENTPPFKWPMGRVIQLHTNTQDGLVRSVSLKTQHGEFKRPIAKLVLLPIDNNL